MKPRLAYAFLLLISFAAFGQLIRNPGSRSSLFTSTVPPSVVINTPTFNQTFQQGDNIAFTATATSRSGIITNVEWIIGNISFSSQLPPYTYILTNAMAGDYVAFAISINSQGVASQSTYQPFSVIAPNNILPTVALTGPADGTKVLAGNPITLTANAADLDGTISGVEFRAGSLLLATDGTAPYSFAWIGPPGTNFLITAVAIDNQGGRATSAPPVYVSFTNYVPPQVTISTPTLNQNFTNGVNVTFTAATVNGSGTVTNVTYTVGPSFTGSASASPWTVVWTNASIGSWNAVAVATDDGNVFTSSAFRPFTVVDPANVPPSVTLTAPTTGTKVLVGNPITITGTATDSDGTIALVEFRAGSLLLSTDVSSPYSYAWTGPPGTNFSVTLVAQDNQGARTTSSPPVLVSFTNSPPVITNQLPTVSITSPANNSSFVFPAPFTLNFAVADSDGTISQLNVFTNGILAQILLAAPWQVNYNALPSGTWTFTGRVYDNLGSNVLSSPITITINPPPNVPPVVAITAPATGSSFTAPADFTIVIAYSDSDGTIAKIELLENNVVTVVNNSPPTGQLAIPITGLASGSKTYRARATDNKGTNTLSAPITIVVTAPPPPAPPAPQGLSALGGNGQVVLSWQASSGASSYTVYRGTDPNLLTTYAANILVLTYTDTAATNGTLFYYTVDGVNSSGHGIQSDQVSVRPLNPNQSTFIQRGSVVRYFSNGTNLGTTWRAVAFDDSSWSLGATPIGYGNSDIDTTISGGPDPLNKYATMYLRYDFNIADASVYTNLLFSALVDDGAAAYLNGTQIFLRNLATSAAFNAHALTPVDGDNRTFVTTNVSSALLLTGANVLAIEVHTYWPDDSDLKGNFELIPGSITVQPVPDAPSGLVAIPFGQNRIDLTWSDNADNESDQQIEASPDGTTYSVITSVAAGITSYQHNGLAAGTKRFYHIRAHNSAGYSSYSEIACAITDSAPPQLLPAPTGLTATAGNATIALKWNPVAGAARYVLQRAIASGGPYYALSSPSVTNYTDNAVTNTVTYYDRVASSNAVGIGPFSAFVSSTPGVGVTVPAAPGGLTATAGAAGIINLSWTDNSIDESGFSIESGNASGGPFTEIGTTGAGVTIFSNSGLGSNVTRFYRVRSYNSAGYSITYSGVVSATTITVTSVGYYVSPSGNGDGSIGNPWGLQQVLNGPSTLLNGTIKEVNLLPGTYLGAYTCSIHASVNQPITFQGLYSVHSANRAIIDRADNGMQASTTVNFGGSYNVFLRNVVIKNSASRWDMNATGNLHNLYAGRAAGFQYDSGQGSKILGCVIHDTGNAISSQNNSSQTGFEANGNIILYPGWDLSTSDAKNEGARGYAHGFYIQHRGLESGPVSPANGLSLLQDNIVGWAFCQGHQLTGSLDGGSKANNHTMLGNVFFMNGYVAQHNSGPATRNMLIGEEVPSTNIVVSENVMYYPPDSDGPSMTLGYNNTAYNYAVSQNLIAQNNYVVGRAFVKQFRNINYTGNTVVHNFNFTYMQGLIDVQSPMATAGTWNINFYYSNKQRPFNINGSMLSFGEWRATTGFDMGSTAPSLSLPTQTFTRLRVLSYDNKGANLTIINWAHTPTVTVSMGGFLSNGDTYEFYSATSPFVLHQSGTYNGTGIVVLTAAANVATMNPIGPWGVINPAKVAPEFNAFRIRKTN